MEKIIVEIDIETAERLFNAVLKSQYGNLSPNIGGVPMYSYDKKENKREFDKLKKAFKLVADYNGVTVDNGVKL